jgi:hypothetical protein
MKKLHSKWLALKIGVAACASFGITPLGFGSVGKAIVPHLSYGYTSGLYRGYTAIYASNITGEPVTVSFTFYTSSGALIQDGDDAATTGALKAYGSFTGYDESPSTGESVTLVLGANQTAEVRIYDNVAASYLDGYGRIEWKQNSDRAVALVSHAKFWYNHNNQWSMTAIPVHGGLPF